jgi:hypothetical protein
VKELKDKIIQHSLFDSTSEYRTNCIQPLSLSISKEALLLWKDKIVNYQNKASTGKLSAQSSLFDLETHDNEFVSINTLELPLQSIEFYRLPISDRGEASIYFILDCTTILYIGETSRSNLRWKGQHDCKRYIENYQNLHYSHGIKTFINAAFWNYAPLETKPRQKLESHSIYHWRFLRMPTAAIQ